MRIIEINIAKSTLRTQAINNSRLHFFLQNNLHRASASESWPNFSYKTYRDIIRWHKWEGEYCRKRKEKKNIVTRGRGKWKCQFDGLRPWEGKLYGPLVWSIEAVVALPQPFALTAASNHLSPADWDSSPLPSLDLIVRLFFKLDFYY